MKYFILAITTLTLWACNTDKKKPDVSDIKVDVTIERFEQAFFQMDTHNLRNGLSDLRNGFPAFYPVFMQHILQVNPMDTSSFAIVRSVYASYKPINDSIQQKYKNLDWLDKDLTQSFKYVKHYYPNYKLPRVITFIGPLDVPGAIITPDYLGIGLHQFAGKNFSVYQDPEIQQMYPAYISRRFDKEYITANAMKAIADDIYPDQSVGRPLIEQMIEKGKSWYLLDHFLPDAPDSVKTGYTTAQLRGVKEHEGNIWAAILARENLYSIEPHVIQTYIGEAPFTQTLGTASPGNIGQWIGWRIVQKFAAENDQLSLQEILATPARQIFEQSKYRPK